MSILEVLRTVGRRFLPGPPLVVFALTQSAPLVNAATYSDANELMRMEVTSAPSIVPNHTLWSFSIEPSNPGWEITTIDAADGDRGFSGAGFRQVNPGGQSTVFSDLNGSFPPSEDATADSQFDFPRAGLLVLADSEGESHLEALFTGFEPIQKTGAPRKFAHVVMPTDSVGTFRGAFAVRMFGSTSPQPAIFDAIVFGGSPAQGDYNSNGSVDAADYVVWRDTIGQVGTGLAADGNGDQQIDAGDYAVWRSNYGNARGGSSVVAVDTVPEATTCTILYSVLVAAGLGRMFDVRNRDRRDGPVARATK